MHETPRNVNKAEDFLMCCNLLLRPHPLFMLLAMEKKGEPAAGAADVPHHTGIRAPLYGCAGQGGRTEGSSLPGCLPHRQNGRGGRTGATLALLPFKAHSENHNPLSLLARQSLPSLSEVLQQQMITLLKSLWPI